MAGKVKVAATPKVLGKVEQMASNGLDQSTIAVLLGYSSRDALFHQHPDNDLFKTSYEVGKGAMLRSLMAVTNRRALDDDHRDCTKNAHYLIDRLDKGTSTASIDAVVSIDIKQEVLDELHTK